MSCTGEPPSGLYHMLVSVSVESNLNFLLAPECLGLASSPSSKKTRQRAEEHKKSPAGSDQQSGYLSILFHIQSSSEATKLGIKTEAVPYCVSPQANKQQQITN